MSLNGLDDSVVVQAHQNTLADPSGWFFLNYINRDTVQLLNRGNGGVTEAKGEVERYQEKSPLFGMLQYRRKRVLLKYVPEGTSRLLQVRLSVQFQSILDAFPHDTVFSFTAPAELLESALGQCTMMLPTVGGSLKSSDSSLRQRRLNEISEDTEDLNMQSRREEPRFARLESVGDTYKQDTNDLNTLPASALRAKALLAKRKEERKGLSVSSITLPLSSQPTQAAPVQTEPASVTEEPLRSLTSLDHLRHRHEIEPFSRPEGYGSDTQFPLYHHSRHLSENESASISQWNDQVTAYDLPGPKPPKKKLAPRPHVDTSSRPKTANTYEENVGIRPVANLPQTIRVSNRPRDSTIIRPGSQQSSRSVPARFNPPPPSLLPPPLPDFNPLQNLFQKAESRKAGSVASSNMTESANATPEKLRLMKALQNRKRTQFLTQRSASAQPSLSTSYDDFPMAHRPSEQMSNLAPIPPTIQEEDTKQVSVPKNILDSSTASPTSIATISEDHSTRPSSFADDPENMQSQKSTSRDTDSSSTPKAVMATAHPASQKHNNWYDSVPDVSPLEEEFASKTPRKTGVNRTDSNDEDQTPKATHQTSQPDKSTLAWLVNSGDLNIVQSIVHTSSPPEYRSSRSHLGVDGLGSPVTECSSVMSEDDALVEDLRKATIHEATPVSVKRPAYTPTMRTLSHDRSRATTLSGPNLTPKSTRSIKAPSDDSPGRQSTHSQSTALPQLPPGVEIDYGTAPLSNKTSLGDGITKRIRALEDSSRKDIPVTSTIQEPSTNRSTLSNMMKRNSFVAQFPMFHTQPEKIASKDLSQLTPTISEASRTSRPWFDRQSSGVSSIKDRTPDKNLSNISIPPRDNRQQDRFSTMFADHHKSTSANPHPTLVTLESRGFAMDQPSPASNKRFSFTSYRSGSTAKSNGRWMHPEPMSSRISLSNKENQAPRAPMSEASSVNEEKRASRASRLMKRVSGFGTRLGGKGPQAPAREDFRPDPIMEHAESADRADSIDDSAMQMIDIGDVNVQFPETLLWKRRFLRIDDQGYLIFAAPTDNQNIRASSRKFHLANLQEPCLPDSEREEMAWSVLLDLRDGNCVQCACGSQEAQSQVLKMLLDAHNAYHSLYPEARP